MMKLNGLPAYGMSFKSICVFFPLKRQSWKFMVLGLSLSLHFVSMDRGKVDSIYYFITSKVMRNAFGLNNYSQN